MKAAVLFEAKTPLRIEDVTIDKPRAHEVLIRTGAWPAWSPALAWDWRYCSSMQVERAC